MKQRRLHVLEGTAVRLRADLAAGRVRICRGGKALARHRHYLLESGLTEAEWRQRWEAARWFIHANGEAGKRYGNETIRVSPGEDGSLVVEIDLPPALAQYANAPDGRYRLRARAFGYRGEDWVAHVHARRACAVLDVSGNPCGQPVDIPLVVAGLPASTRDGHLRTAISQAIHLAQRHRCAAVACEFLDFEDVRAASREHGQLGPRVRATIVGIPTAQFRERLVRMAARTGLAVIYVDPAYSSIWGAQYWQRAVNSPRHIATRHQAAAVVLGRRALGHAARRRAEVTAPHRRMEATGSSVPVGAEGSRLDRAGDTSARRRRSPPRQPGSGIRRAKTGPGNGDVAGAQALQDRSGALRGLS